MMMMMMMMMMVCVFECADAFTIMVPEENQTFPVSGVSDHTIMGLY